MKTAPGLLLSVLLLLFTALLPSPARAQSPIDCSNGCYIITCNAQLCSLWRCDSSGCEYVTGWDREVAEGPQLAGRTAKASASPPQVAYASVCPPDRRCDLYEITVTEALRLGSFDNAADLVRHRASLRQPPALRK